MEPTAVRDAHQGVTSAETAQAPVVGDGPRDQVAAGFDVVYEALWAPIARFAHLVAGSRAVGEDLAQEAFLGLYKHFDRVEHPQAYLRRSVVNAATKLRRSTLREAATLTEAREPVQLPPDVDHAWALIAGLPPRQRAVLVLRFYNDLPEAEIAQLLGCRPGTVKSLCARALERLRKDLT